MYLSIDFEDYKYDLGRSLGLKYSNKINEDILWDKYNFINETLKSNSKGEGQYATFFCTGILAEKAPRLIRKMVSDGHEIGCHYYFHDFMINQEIKNVKKMLVKAKNILEDVSQKEVLGFRAPYFAIKKDTPEQYQIIEEFFKYDSSFFCSSKDELIEFKKRMNLKKLFLIPLFSKKLFGKNLRLGGSYVKLFPFFYSYLMYKLSNRNNFDFQIYMHPYEFGRSLDLYLNHNDLKNLPFTKKYYWLLRQHQWLSIGNKSIVKKLNQLIKIDGLSGKLSNIYEMHK